MVRNRAKADKGAEDSDEEKLRKKKAEKGGGDKPILSKVGAAAVDLSAYVTFKQFEEVRV